MCRMAALSARYPLSLQSFMTYFFLPLIPDTYNKDGWGFACFLEGECLMFKGREPARESTLLRVILDRVELKSNQAILHVRRATKGRVTMANAHPFVRELWGMPWVFVHHGEVDVINRQHPGPQRFRPVGDTDTEHLFCWLLNHMWHRFQDRAPPTEELISWMADITCSAKTGERCNFILANPHIVFAFYGGHRSLFWRIEEALNPVVQVSSTPLFQAETWQEFRKGELKVIADGAIKVSL